MNWRKGFVAAGWMWLLTGVVIGLVVLLASLSPFVGLIVFAVIVTTICVVAVASEP